MKASQRAPRFSPLIFLVFFSLIFSPWFKYLSVRLGARPRCKGLTGGRWKPPTITPSATSLQTPTNPKTVPGALNQAQALMAFVMANYKGATRGRLIGGGPWPRRAQALGVTRDSRRRTKKCTPLPPRPRQQQTHKTPSRRDVLRRSCSLCPGGMGDRKKIIIICKINKLFCQDFQRHHHSCANRFAVTQRPPLTPSGQKQAKLHVHGQLCALNFTSALDPNSQLRNIRGLLMYFVKSDCKTYYSITLGLEWERNCVMWGCSLQTNSLIRWLLILKHHSWNNMG